MELRLLHCAVLLLIAALAAGANGYALTTLCSCNSTDTVVQCTGGTIDAAFLVSAPGTLAAACPLMTTLNFFAVSGLSTVPGGLFQGLTKLDSLSFSFCSVVTVSPSAFMGISQLTDLGLAHNTIATLPSNVFDALPNLLSLDLTDNQLAGPLSGLFYTLTRLTILLLGSNRLTQLAPGQFVTNRALATLFLGQNQLKSFNSVSLFPAQAQSLNSLDLSFNQFTSVTATMFSRLTGLTILRLNNNSITALSSSSFQNLSLLGTLDVQGNAIKSIEPRTFRVLPALSNLALEGNPISLIDANLFSGLASLTQLTCTGSVTCGTSSDIQCSTAIVGSSLASVVGCPLSDCQPLTWPNANTSACSAIIFGNTCSVTCSSGFRGGSATSATFQCGGSRWYGYIACLPDARQTNSGYADGSFWLDDAGKLYMKDTSGFATLYDLLTEAQTCDLQISTLQMQVSSLKNSGGRP
eukprot:m.191173 g.191173  ORF g.191173 m.191173 type:complete len:467 (+) comp17565_c1_seq49:2718-4118(+)